MANTSMVVHADSLIDGTGTDPIRNAAILIRDGVISYAGPEERLPVLPADVVTLDASGLTLLPGLMNLHVHLSVDERVPRRLDPEALEETRSTLGAYSRALRCIERGVTLVRDLGAPHWGLVKLRDALRAGWLTGPRILACGKAVCITGGHAYVIGEEADGPDDVAKAARRQLKMGADFVKIMAEAGSAEGALDLHQPQMSLAEMRAAAAVAHRAGRHIAAHAMTPTVIKLCLDAEVDVIEHGYDLDDECIERMVLQETWLIPTVQVYDRILAGKDQPGMDRYKPHASQAKECAQRSLPKAIDAGVKIACGTDAGSPANPPEDLVPELQSYVAAGLTPMQALQTATRYAAELIGQENKLGTLEAGKLADIVATDGDPLADFAALYDVRLVIKDGETVVNHI